MFSLSTKILLLISPILSFMTNSWTFFWILLEISSMMFLNSSMNEEETKKKEILLIYFIMQSLASILFLFSIFSLSSYSKNMVDSGFSFSVLIFIMFMIKMGMAPFHFWLIKLIDFFSWSSLVILMLWQKLIPISILLKFLSMKSYLMLCLVSLLMGMLSQLKINMTKKLMLFSSIAHMGWMLSASLHQMSYAFMYLSIYSMVLMPIFIYMNKMNLNFLLEQFPKNMMITMVIMLLSLSGIPPFLGFLLKWVSLTAMKKTIFFMFAFSMMACLSFYIYTRLIYKSFVKDKTSFKMNGFKYQNKSLIYFNMIIIPSLMIF